MNRQVTKQDLQKVLDAINSAAGQKLEPWYLGSDGRWYANIGTYVLDWAIGGVKLCRLDNKSGGVSDVTLRGTKRETYERMQAFLDGLYS